MLPEGNHLSSVGNVHVIKGAFDALADKSGNVRSAGKRMLALMLEVNKPILNFDVWGNITQLNHLIHFCVSESEFAIVTKCKWLQMKLFVVETISFRHNAMKSQNISDDFIQYASKLRFSRGVL